MVIDPKPVVTLLTDFGIQDSYVGQMKGIILGINPAVTLVDITHSIAAHDIRQGAFTIFTAWQAFPPGTIHLCVVDPGVGSDRRGLIIEKDRHFFVGPDNGLFSFLLEFSDGKRSSASLYSIGRQGTAARASSTTFHGRDIFAPTAARLSLGAAVSSFGPEVVDWVQLRIPLPKQLGESIKGEVIHVDGFGNLITNITGDTLRGFRNCGIRVGQSLHISGISETYSDVSARSPLAYWGSAGFLELALREGNLARAFDLAVGCEIILVREGGDGCG
ncbi:MAG: SAM-dependent chlorinase/fluorinase [FCB group bacterium]|nr:SAM-dependent chlorinase/fluorinase [FCB group bacterium]